MDQYVGGARGCAREEGKGLPYHGTSCGFGGIFGKKILEVAISSGAQVALAMAASAKGGRVLTEWRAKCGRSTRDQTP